MSTIQTPVPAKPFDFWNATDGFFKDVDSLRKVADLFKETFRIIGDTFSQASGFTEMGKAFGEASSYIGATLFPSHIIGWMDYDDKGQLRMLKDCGSVATKLGSVICFQVKDALDMVGLLDKWQIINLGAIAEKIGQIPIFSWVTSVSFTLVKNLFVGLGSILAVLDAGLVIHRAVTTLRDEQVYLDWKNFFSGGDLLRTHVQGPDGEARIKKATQALQTAAIGLLKNALKLALVALSVLNVAAPGLMAVLAITYVVLSLVGIAVKHYHKLPAPERVQQAWQQAQGIPMERRARNEAV